MLGAATWNSSGDVIHKTRIGLTLSPPTPDIPHPATAAREQLGEAFDLQPITDFCMYKIVLQYFAVVCTSTQETRFRVFHFGMFDLLFLRTSLSLIPGCSLPGHLLGNPESRPQSAEPLRRTAALCRRQRRRFRPSNTGRGAGRGEAASLMLKKGGGGSTISSLSGSSSAGDVAKGQVLSRRVNSWREVKCGFGEGSRHDGRKVEFCGEGFSSLAGQSLAGSGPSRAWALGSSSLAFERVTRRRMFQRRSSFCHEPQFYPAPVESQNPGPHRDAA
jgi:hypothetical protein